jgi:NodT family efflux transporter outer membrane factor (OMF) lipoprotein
MMSAATIASMFALALTACSVGPNFKRPPAPAADRYTVQPLPGHTDASDGPAGAAQAFASGEKIPPKWWTLYGSSALNELVDQALQANPNVQSGQAALRKAHENVLAAWGVLAPAIDASTDGARQRVSGVQFGPTGEPAIYNLYNASINVSYGLDFFGRARRSLESLRAQRDYQRFALQATYLTLAANVVTTAVAEASLREQILATEQLIESSGKRLAVIEKQRQLGGASLADALSQRAQLAQDRATLPGLRSQLDQQRSLLATLLGRVPSDQPSAVFRLDELRLPATIPLSIPSQLVTQRPDVRQQEELLHQASAQVGVATANMLPQITLSASYGGSTSNFDTLLQSASRVWSVSAGVTQPIFHGGQLLHERRAALAAYDEAAAQYRETVLTAFRNVADSLRALHADAETLNAVHEAHEAAAASLAITDRQYALGGTSYLALLTAQRTERQTRVSLIQAQAARLADTAALFQALGGGTWEKE